MKKSILLSFLLSVFMLSGLFADLNDTFREQVPGKYYSRCSKAGTTSLFKYKAAAADRTAIVYLPYGYDESDEETRYPVLFLMHGGGGTAASYIGPAGSPNQLAWIFDNAIAAGEIKPMIVVFPNDSGAFYAEFRNFLLPAVDSSFNTIAQRDARIFGGFSMGAVETWNVFLHDLDLVKNFIPMSGDSWVCGNTGGKNFPEKTAYLLSQADNIEKYKNEFRIFAATGTTDSAYANMVPQIKAMKEKDYVFKYTNLDFTFGNFMFYVVKGNVHSYTHTYEYLYNALKLFN